MNSFSKFLALLSEITDHRRKEGKLYELAPDSLSSRDR
jgi:hypothetical protein